jgi:thioesterase domain-containing protein
MTAAAALEHTLHDEIPISLAMGIRVANYDGQIWKLAAPLVPNINQKSTAFGASLCSLGVLWEWGMLHLKLAQAGLHKHIVMREGNIRYLQPVGQNILAECCLDDAVFKNLLRTLGYHGRARLAIDVVIKHNGHPALEFSGRYVVHR